MFIKAIYIDNIRILFQLTKITNNYTTYISIHALKIDVLTKLCFRFSLFILGCNKAHHINK